MAPRFAHMPGVLQLERYGSPEVARGFWHGAVPDGGQGRYVSDRSQLTVSKPNSLNARQEAFARNIAEGCCQREAYKRAGYTPTSDNVADVNASRLLRHAQVQSRVRELQAAQAEASKITAEKLLAELEEARSLALILGQAGAAVAASMGRAKLCGLLVDRREDVTRRPSRDPDAPAEVEVEVWLREIATSTNGRACS